MAQFPSDFARQIRNGDASNITSLLLTSALVVDQFSATVVRHLRQ